MQYKNVLIALFDIPAKTPPGPKTVVPPDAAGNAIPSPGPRGRICLLDTVANFRKAGYDEVFETQLSARWTEKEVLGGEGLIADGRRNVWICQMGREAVDGEFRAWADRIAASSLRAQGLVVDYDAPGVGKVHVSWDDPLTVDGVEVPLSGYDRFDNPYCRAP